MLRVPKSIPRTAALAVLAKSRIKPRMRVSGVSEPARRRPGGNMVDVLKGELMDVEARDRVVGVEGLVC